MDRIRSEPVSAPQADEYLVVVDGGRVRDRDDQVPEFGIA
jgi:hypothetical protein